MVNFIGPKRVTLPNGMEISCQRREEALLVFGEVGGYVRHGMSLREADVIFDVGANIGLFSLWAYEECRRNASIFAFEPLPPIFSLLAHNLGSLGDSRVKPMCFGLSNRSARVRFAYHPHATFASTAFPEPDDLDLTETLLARSLDSLPKPLHLTQYLPAPLRHFAVKQLARVINWSRPIECELRTLSSVVRDNHVERIDFLKIDAEKSELDVLEGIEEHHWPIVRQAFVEVHDKGERVEKIQRMFKDHGFSKIVAEQEDFFKGTDIYGVSAMR